jgi:type II secretory pathway component PulF
MVIFGATLYFIPTMMRSIFDDFGTELPMLTQSLINVSSAMNALGWETWAAISLGMGVCLAIVTFFGGSGAGRRWSTSIPVIGRVFQYAALSDLCRLVALLAEADLPLPKTLRFAADASDDAWLSDRCRMVADDIETGTSPSTAAAMANLPSSLGVAFRNAASKSSFVEALRSLADIYAARCLNSTQLVSSVITPFVVAIVVGCIGIMVVALFLPLIKLLNDLS